MNLCILQINYNLMLAPAFYVGLCFSRFETRKSSIVVQKTIKMDVNLSLFVHFVSYVVS